MSAEDVATSDKIVTVRIIIGRTNPPHSGHIKLMKAAIDAAKGSPGPIKCALLLLGNGPGGQRTNEDPIDHQTKSSFIRIKLMNKGYTDNVDFVIQEMKTTEQGGPSQNILDFLLASRINPNSYDGSIDIIQHTGNKPGKASKSRRVVPSDSEKHEGLRSIIKSRIKSIYIHSPSVECRQESVDAEPIYGETPMSATKVREKAVSCYQEATDLIDGGEAAAAADPAALAAMKLADGFECWKETFDFYSGNPEALRLSKIMYDSIIEHKDNKYKPVKRPSKGDPSFVVTSKSRLEPGKAGSRRKHTRKRILRNKKTLRRNRNNRKHRHTRR